MCQPLFRNDYLFCVFVLPYNLTRMNKAPEKEKNGKLTFNLWHLLYKRCACDFSSNIYHNSNSLFSFLHNSGRVEHVFASNARRRCGIFHSNLNRQHARTHSTPWLRIKVTARKCLSRLIFLSPLNFSRAVNSAVQLHSVHWSLLKGKEKKEKERRLLLK